jgi:hypothetical protein
MILTNAKEQGKELWGCIPKSDSNWKQRADAEIQRITTIFPVESP